MPVYSRTAGTPSAPNPLPSPTMHGAAEHLRVVGIGASAGGLEACQQLVAGLPGDIGMAFVLIQHLDPTHESMMVDLLATQTSLVVQEAADGMLIEPNHLYTIHPGTYLSVDAGVLRVSQPQQARGSRLPFDFLLASLATAYEERAVCVILSGTGADGTQGLRAIKKNAGLVISQDPADAAYDGMPRSAIATGEVDLVLPVAGIAELLVRYALLPPGPLVQAHASPPDEIPDWLPPSSSCCAAGPSTTLPTTSREPCAGASSDA